MECYLCEAMWTADASLLDYSFCFLPLCESQADAGALYEQLFQSPRERLSGAKWASKLSACMGSDCSLLLGRRKLVHFSLWLEARLIPSVVIIATNSRPFRDEEEWFFSTASRSWTARLHAVPGSHRATKAATAGSTPLVPSHRKLAAAA